MSVALLFAGCGWMHPFEFGAGKAFAGMMDLNDPSVTLGGCSSGAVVASGLAVGMDIDVLFERTLEIYDACKTLPFGMCGGVKRVLRSMSVGDEEWRRASGKLVVGLSAVGFRGCTPEYVSKFNDAEHAIEVLRASCHLPFVGGVLPYSIKGHRSRYYDGGISMIIPELPETDVFKITIDGRPTVEGIDIVPDLGFTVPVTWSYFPRNPEMLRLFYRLGYLRAVEFMSSGATASKVRQVIKPPFLIGREERLEAARAEISTIVARLQPPRLQP